MYRKNVFSSNGDNEFEIQLRRTILQIGIWLDYLRPCYRSNGVQSIGLTREKMLQV